MLKWPAPVSEAVIDRQRLYLDRLGRTSTEAYAKLLNIDAQKLEMRREEQGKASDGVESGKEAT